MSIEQRINEFNKANAPFYIVALKNGDYSLCFNLDFLIQKYKDFGQYAFNRYAESIGEPITRRNMYTHGDGYEWETVFKKYFENESGINDITFDCELGGFYCDSKDYDLIESFGKRFRELCGSEEEFTEIVCKALKENAENKTERDECEISDEEYNAIYFKVLKNELIKRGMTSDDEITDKDICDDLSDVENRSGPKMN